MHNKTKPEKRSKMGKVKQHKAINNRTDFFYYTFRNILLVSLPLVVICGLVLSHLSLHSSATISNSETDSLTLTLSTSCTLSSSVEEAHTASLNGGQYEDDIGSTKVNAYCNDNNGYSIYAIGSSGDIDGNTDLISNINDNYNIHTGIYDSSSVSSYTPSSWSMKLSPGSGTGINPDTGESIDVTPPTIRNNYDSYSIVPNVYTLVASRPSNTNMTVDTNASGSYFTTTYDIYAASFQPSGTYSGKVKYLMVHPHSDASITNIDTAFARVGKTKVYSVKNGNYYYAMQDMATDICSLVTGDGDSTSAQLVDNRDGNIYWVTKLKDGHCWMTQNLDFDITANTTLNSMTTDLNVAYNSTTGQYAEYNDGYSVQNDIIYWAPVGTATTIDFTGTTVTDWQKSNTGPYSANKTDDDNTGHASLGNYYNWTAAIASNNSSTLTTDTLDNISNNPKNSICPKGWRLPTISNQSETIISSTNEFARLNYLYNENSTVTNENWTISPIYLVRSGGVSADNINQTIGINGFLWSNTIKDEASAYYLRINGYGQVIVNDTAGGKYNGRPIRCLAK